jgi:hypothetical protein
MPERSETVMAVENLLKINEYLAKLVPAIQQEINEWKSIRLTEAAHKFFIFKTLYDEMDKLRKDIGSQLEYVNKGLMPSKFDDDKTDITRVPEIGRSFTLQTKYSASIVEGMREPAFEWLQEYRPHLIVTTTNAQTMAADFKEMITKEGKDPPEDLFNFRSYHTTGINKYTPKAEIGKGSK